MLVAIVAAVLLLANIRGDAQTAFSPCVSTGCWFYLEGDFVPADLGPGDFDMNSDDLDSVTELTLANGSLNGDPSVLFLRMKDHPGMIHMFSTERRWAHFQYDAGDVVNNGTSFTFHVRPVDAQLRMFRDGERVAIDFDFWPKEN